MLKLNKKVVVNFQEIAVWCKLYIVQANLKVEVTFDMMEKYAKVFKDYAK